MNLIGAIGQEIKDMVCEGLDITSIVPSLLASVISGEGLRFEANKWSTFLCNKNPSSLPSTTEAPAFLGGQCAGINYLVRFDYKRFGVQYSGQSALIGKVLGIRISPNGLDLQLQSSVQGFVTVVASGNGGFSDPKITSVSRFDGLPDNCGNLPTSDIPSIDSHEENRDINYNDDNGNPVSLPNVPFKFFKPCVNIDGVRIPFEVNLGFTKVCGKIGFRTDFKNLLEPDIDFDLCPSEKQSFSIPQKDLSDFFELDSPVGNASGVPESSLKGNVSSPTIGKDFKPILGVFVASKRDGSNSQKETIIPSQQVDSPALVVPYLALVRFHLYLPQSNGYSSSFSSDIRIKTVEEFVPCPWQFGAIGYEVIWSKGWTGKHIAARRKSCCEACEKNDPNKGLDNWDRCHVD